MSVTVPVPVLFVSLSFGIIVSGALVRHSISVSASDSCHRRRDQGVTKTPEGKGFPRR
jgi:hypothetical protein